MQNPDGAAASAAQQQQRETTESLALLREAVLRLTQHAVRAAPTAAPTSRLTKLGPEDDVEAYLEVFERTSRYASTSSSGPSLVRRLVGAAVGVARTAC